MCGVFGFVSSGERELNLDRLQRIAKVTESRGHDAFGFAWIDRCGKLHSFKQAGRITDRLSLLEMAADARMLIGHCRWTTQGDERSNVNNHPHPADGGWIVHNGVVPGYRQTIRDFGLLPVSDCDSEVLGLLIEQFTGRLSVRCAKAVNAAAPSVHQPLVMLGLWTRPARLVVVKRGNPLHQGLTKAGTYFASLPDELPGKPTSIRDRSVHVFTDKWHSYSIASLVS